MIVKLVFFSFGIAVFLYIVSDLFIKYLLWKQGYKVKTFDWFFDNYKNLKRLGKKDQRYYKLFVIVVILSILPLVIFIVFAVYLAIKYG